MSLEFRFFEYGMAVRGDLEPSAPRRRQLDLGIRKSFSNLSRQTDGPRFVVSHHAVFDRDFHRWWCLVAGGEFNAARPMGDVSFKASASAVSQRGMLFAAAIRLITLSCFATTERSESRSVCI